jgi:phosphoesterase RecJ-like protein
LGKIFILDHHVTDEDHGNGQFIDPTACAAGVLVYRLAQLAGVKISMAMAKNIYACILTDTGSFRYSSTNPEALRVASEFVEMGIEPWFFASQIYENHPPQKLRLLAEVLATLKISEDGLVALIHLDQNTMDRFPDSSELTDGFINFPRSITGVEVAIFLRGNADGSFKASMRSVGNVDVSEICKRYGGGGHRNAAGCSIKEWNKGLDDLIQNLMETAREFCRRQKLS